MKKHIQEIPNIPLMASPFGVTEQKSVHHPCANFRFEESVDRNTSRIGSRKIINFPEEIGTEAMIKIVKTILMLMDVIIIKMSP
jgi:hypothetical protein